MLEKIIPFFKRQAKDNLPAIHAHKPSVAIDLPDSERYDLEEIAVMYAQIAKGARGGRVRWSERADGAIVFRTDNCGIRHPPKSFRNPMP